MERFTVTATSSSTPRLPRRPISEGEQTPLPYPSFPMKPQLRDPSFSNYLRPDQEPAINNKPVVLQKPITTVAQHAADENEISIFDAEKYFNEGQEHKGSTSTNSSSSPANTNLDRIVETYDIPAIRRFSSEGYTGRNYRTRSFHATPTASSEASWNSQSGLLSNPPGSIAVSMRNIRLDDKKRSNSSSSSSSSSSSWFFRRNCPCSGKKSVQVEEKFSEPKTPIHSSSTIITTTTTTTTSAKKQRPKLAGDHQVGIQKELGFEKRLEIDDDDDDNDQGRTKVKLMAGTRDHSAEAHFAAEIGRRVVSSSQSFNDTGGFSFPILNPTPSGKLMLNSGTSKQETAQLEEPPRESLEVFRPSDESIGRSFNFPTSPRGRPTAATPDDDIVSDASSDLFEIESFSTQSTMYPLYKRRDSLDDMSSVDGRSRLFVGNGLINFRRSMDETTATTTPSIAPTECYEPSEASIEWSVTTAEGFDRASVTNTSISASEFEDMRYSNGEAKKTTATAAAAALLNGRSRKGNNSGLLSCRCEKAVNVGPHPMRYLAEQRRFGPGFPIESARIQAAPIAATGLQPARSHSARISTR